MGGGDGQAARQNMITAPALIGYSIPRDYLAPPRSSAALAPHLENARAYLTPLGSPHLGIPGAHTRPHRKGGQGAQGGGGGGRGGGRPVGMGEFEKNPVSESTGERKVAEKGR